MDIYGIIGNPVEHSLSPPMHEAAYDETGYDARYCKFPVEDGDVETAVKGAEALGIKGLNVTIPHKQAVAELDAVENDPTAEKMAAVNTLDLEEMKGYNTDGVGAIRALEHHGVEVDGAEVVVVGAGGAARAVCFALSERDTRIRIANRTPEKARDLADELGGSAEGYSLDALKDTVSDADILINATSVGMEEDDTPVPAEYLDSDLVVFDVVYSPLETRLLRDAKEVGAKTVDGAWMLVFQGVEAFEIWTGKKPPVDVMNTAVRRRLKDD